MNNKLSFLIAAVAVTGAAVLVNAPAAGQSAVNLVPQTPCAAPSYYCTWAAQNYMYGQGDPSIDAKRLEGGSGMVLAWKAVNEENLFFGPRAWTKTFYPKVRPDLFFLLDDGWGTSHQDFVLDPAKFPSFLGEPQERLKKLNGLAKQAGWRGAALWVRFDKTPAFEEGIPLVQWSKYAGIGYWKIDGGDMDFAFVKHRDEMDPGLMLEHIQGSGPLNGDWKQDGRFGSQAQNMSLLTLMAKTDTYRTYDVTTLLSLPSTLDRVTEIFKLTAGHPDAKAYLNCEDEVYVAAVLGCTMGVMRHPMVGLRPSGDPDVFFAGSRQVKKRMDEVARALRWQRIAAPYSVGQGTIKADNQILTDDWVFQPGQTWDSEIIGQDVKQGAPARIARNLDLPTVTGVGEAPFVFAGRFPNGAVAIAAQERTLKGRDWFMPLADVVQNVGDAKGPFGVFGHFRSLTLQFDHALGTSRILAQDLAGEKAVDITKQIQIKGNLLIIPGSVIDKYGLADATPGDLSDPGLVIALRKRPG